ncbi:MAG: zinc-binding dehydrogenase [Acidimicrobiia bacterium]|nr:zinc-binding dehydrogenase [Acidimicrobiia bacterium]
MTVPESMRAVVLTGHGDLDKLEYRSEFPTPNPGLGEVLIEVAACGMNNTDVNTRTGWYSKTVTTATGEDSTDSDVDGSWGGGLTFPRVQGADIAGHIVAVGPGVDGDRVGERVIVDGWLRDPDGILENAGYLGSERDGGYAEYATVPAINAYPIDADVTDVELASFQCSYATAEHMLHRANVSEGQWVLVTGPSGGVGSGLVQLSKRRGANVIALTSAHKTEDVKAIGADVVLDRSAPDVAARVRDASNGGVDVFADVVGGDNFAPLFEMIRRGGHYTTAGAIAGPIVPLDLRTLYLHDITMHGCTVLPPAVFADLVGYIVRGEVKPVVAATYPLERLREAQEAFVQKQHVGAFVIEVSQ